MITVKDELFLLVPSFTDAAASGGPFHCSESAQIEGLLSYYPFLRTRLNVHYIDFARPRAALVERLGMEHQSCPVLIVAESRTAPANAQQAANGRKFLADPAAIAAYMSAIHGIPIAHP